MGYAGVAGAGVGAGGVAGVGAATGALPRTGIGVGLLVALAVILLVLGFALVHSARRRTATPAG